MKKFMVIALALAMAVAFAAPAFAKVTIGTQIKLATGYKGYSEERTTSGKSVTSFWAAIEGHSRINFSFINAAKDTGAFVELGLSSYTSASVSMRHAYGWYKVGNFKLLVGHTDNLVGSLFSVPSQNVAIGGGNLKLLFIGWGAQWGARRPQVQGYWRSASKNGAFGVQFGIAQPLRGSNVPWTGSYDLYYTLPEFFLAIEFRAGGFAIIPSFTWTRYQAEGLTSGIDDSVDGWGIEVPLKYNVGPISIRFGVSYAKNPSLTPWDNYADSANGLPVLAASGKFEETTMTAGYFGLHYYAGAFKVYAGVGMTKFENDTWAKKDYTRLNYFIACRYEVNKNLFIHPELGLYDYGDDKTTGHDAGQDWVLGVLIQFTF